jgi:hypothetical protein
MKSKGYSFAYWFAAVVNTLAILVLLVVVGASAQQPAIYLASVVLVVTCIAFLIIIPAILLSMLRNSRQSADYLEHLANQQKKEGPL